MIVKHIHHTVLIAFLILISCTLRAQESNDAGAYLEHIGNQYTEVSKDLMSYTSAASHGKGAKKVEKKRQELIGTMKEAESTVRKMRPFQGDHQLRDSVASYFRLSRLVLLEDYGKIVDMEDIAEQSYDAMEAYMLAKEKANDKLEHSYDRVHEQHSLFAKKNNIRIIESETKLSQKLESSGKVYNYYNKVYLLFFKSFKDEAYLMEALAKGDVNAIEQTKSALANSSSAGLGKLNEIGLFNNDATMKNVCQQFLAFYQQEATDKATQQVDFFLKKKTFEKMKKAIDAKRQNDRTQSDIDLFNKSLNEFNQSVNKFNSINNELNKKRSDLINLWNKTSDSFLSRYVPRYR